MSKKKNSSHCPLYVSLSSYFCYCILFIVGFVTEYLFGISSSQVKEKNREGYAPLFTTFESFYTRNIFRRMKDVFSIPISSLPGPLVEIVHRVSHDHFWSFSLESSTKTKCINFGSYNYLGFSENSGKITEAVIHQIHQGGLTNCSPAIEFGTSEVTLKLRKRLSSFLGTENSLLFGNGFATNTQNIPVLLDKQCLALSDEYNHASLILGLRLSGATIMVFKHNNMDNLEKILKQTIIRGHPRTRRPWKKIFIFVEGIYSMEGSIVNLPQILYIKKKYGVYIYLDESHSIGALGSSGKGVVDFYGLDSKDIDLHMGTFSKSFGSQGGYIAGSHQLIRYLQKNSIALHYGSSLSSPIAMQTLCSLTQLLESQDGKNRILRLSSNAKYFRRHLKEMGFILYGHDHCPLIPLLLSIPSKIRGFVKEMIKHNIATVAVGFPATPITEERARFCISASHTKEMLDRALSAISSVGDKLKIKYQQSSWI